MKLTLLPPPEKFEVVHVSSKRNLDEGMKADESCHDAFRPQRKIHLRHVETEENGDHCNDTRISTR